MNLTNFTSIRDIATISHSPSLIIFLCESVYQPTKQSISQSISQSIYHIHTYMFILISISKYIYIFIHQLWTMFLTTWPSPSPPFPPHPQQRPGGSRRGRRPGGAPGGHRGVAAPGAAARRRGAGGGGGHLHRRWPWPGPAARGEPWVGGYRVIVDYRWWIVILCNDK